MLNVYLCDDNEVILNKYAQLLHAISKSYQIPIHILTFTSGEQLLFHLDNNMGAVDILYLDIMMGGDNGIETAKKLRAGGCNAQIIFLTANAEYVFDSFDVLPLHYLLKDDVSSQHFENIFFKAALMSEKKTKSVFVCSGQNGSIKKQIPFQEIAYFEVRNRIVSVHYGKNSFDFYAKLDTLEQDLKIRDFVRVHRSYLIHLPFIDSLHKDSIILISGEKIPLGVTYAKDVKLVLHHYMNILQ